LGIRRRLFAVAALALALAAALTGRTDVIFNNFGAAFCHSRARGRTWRREPGRVAPPDSLPGLQPEETAMTTRMSCCFGPRSANRPKAARSARLAVEALEGRRVPTVTFHGGALLPHVEAQALYLGSDWANSSTYHQQAVFLDGFLNTVVDSSYMDALTTAGYNVGRGSATPGVIDSVAINKKVYLDDSTIRGVVQAAIDAGALQAPDSNTLYVVFVEDNVAVTNGGGNSQNDFTGYHTAFAGTDASGHAASIRYAVITYPGGTVGNAGDPYLPTLDSMTDTASHELAEAVTDPDVNYKTLGWYDTQLGGEVGDITNMQATYLDGYAVQRISDKKDHAMTPAGAIAARPVTFVLLSNGTLREHTKSGWTTLATGVAYVSNQGVDNNGRALVDVISTTGEAYEYHDGLGWLDITGGVAQAEAGQGVSYVLLSNGSLYEVKDADGTVTFLKSGVTSISAGTDKYGVSMVDVVLASHAASEYSDTSGWHALKAGVQQVSAGQMGVSEVLLTNGNAYDYREATKTWTLLGSNVAQIEAGVDASGDAMIDLVDDTGAMYEYTAAKGWTELATGVATISKARAGVVDAVLTNLKAYEHTALGWALLTSSAVEAV
jgi:hypothetical protein